VGAFDDAFASYYRAEGDFNEDPDDNDNWTGGILGAGSLNGTKYGISAARYPQRDIVNLTREDAAAIYKRDYWDRIGGDALPPVLAVEAFDAAMTHGVGRVPNWLREAIKLAQELGGVPVDGVMGPQTKAALGNPEIARAAALEFLAHRARFLMCDLGQQQRNATGLGWSRIIIERAAAIGAA
jgi:lysozyme family protein